MSSDFLVKLVKW